MVNLPIFLFLNCLKFIQKFANIEFKPISRVANLNGRMRVSEGGLRLDSQNFFYEFLNELTNANFIFMKAKRKRVIKITIKEVKDILEVGAKVMDIVDKTVKLIKKFK